MRPREHGLAGALSNDSPLVVMLDATIAARSVREARYFRRVALSNYVRLRERLARAWLRGELRKLGQEIDQ